MVEIHEVRDGEESSADDQGSLRQRGGVVANPATPGDPQVPAEQDGPPVQNPNQPTPLEKFMAIVKSLILRGLVVYFFMTFLKSSPSPSKQAIPAAGPGQSSSPATFAYSNIFPNGTVFDLFVYSTEEESYEIKDFTKAKLQWHKKGLIYGDWYGGPEADGTFKVTVNIELSEKVQNNGSVYLHTYIVKPGGNPESSAGDIFVVHNSKMFNRFKKKRYAKTHNLLTGETSASLEDQAKAKVVSSEIISHWHPNLTISLVTDWTAWTPGSVPAPLNEYIQFLHMEQQYKPVIYFNDYWNLKKDYQPINNTVQEISVTLTFQPLSLIKWQLFAAQNMRNQWAFMAAGAGDEDEDDQDTLKEALLDTNPYLLGLTFVVSILHSVFEFLAFKNDIQFWNNRKSLEGLSVRSVIFGVFQSTIVLLYVLDNDTNFVIRVSVFIGLFIEIWKVQKVMDVKVDRENKVLGIFPRLVFSDKGSYVESSTRQYDILAFRYLSWLLFPLLVGYAVYSLIYIEQKGWYSWVLSLMYGFLLTFGFIMMTPQLFINYKLKSVAHLPWRMLTYKFLNTFIDDIFAFVIKMPTMYRIGCLRDDVIFFIFLYQKYIYKIDLKRVNEFGFTGEEIITGKAKEIENGGPTGENGVLAVEPSTSHEGQGTEGGSSPPDKKNQ